MMNFWHTVCFTYKNKIKSKFFIISTLIFALAIVGIMNYSNLKDMFAGNEKSTTSGKIIVNNLSESYLADKITFEEVFKNQKVEFIDNEQEAEDELNKSIENVMLKIEDSDTEIYSISILSKRHADTHTVAMLQNIGRQLAKYSIMNNLSIQEDIQATLMVEPEVSVVSYETDIESKMAVAYFIVFGFMILMNFYVQGVATTIVSEKSNRVIEVLLTSSKSTELFFGKIIGNCLASLTQIISLGVLSVVAYNLSDVEPIKLAGATVDFSILNISQLVIIGTFFILGYLLYSIAAGALAAFVSNNDDLNQSLLPVTICFMASVALAMVYMINPNLDIIGKLSYIPIVSPMIIIVKVVMFGMSAQEIAINIAIMIVTIIVLALLGSKMYSNGTLNDNKKLKLKALLK